MRQKKVEAGEVFIEGGTLEEINAFFLERGWSDGLPVVPPTPERVARFVAASGRDPLELIGKIPPRWGQATVQMVAINAVMAGCRPEYMHALLATIQAMCQEEFNLASVQATTHPCGALSIFHGPIRQQLQINCASGLFGPGWQANATIGRAVRLVLLNVGGGFPGTGDMSTQGQPCKYSYCMGENEEESPWEPYHVGLGYRDSDSAVTIVAADSPRNVLERSVVTGASLLVALTNAAAAYGSNNVLFGRGELIVVLCPEHAQLLAHDGYSKRDVRDYLWEHATVDLGRFPAETREWRLERDREDGITQEDGDRRRVVRAPEDIHVLVGGGPGKHSCVITTPGRAKVITVPVPIPAAVSTKP